MITRVVVRFVDIGAIVGGITGFVTRLTRRVPLVEQELLTSLENMSSHPVLVGFALVCPFVFVSCGHWVVSVIHRYTDSDYPFGTFKLFLTITD